MSQDTAPDNANDVLDRFSRPTRAWFEGAFHAPTPAQREAWDTISAGQHALVIAPTGSGKTLAAFLWALDRLAVAPPPARHIERCRVLYVSPLKALAVDVERNLRSPLTGIRHAARRLGEPEPDIDVAIRSGDTPADARRRFARKPPDVLITTPESLFLLLTSQAREALCGVETVIVDEVHAVAGTKRGAHLALSLERLEDQLPRPVQRIGLSATVRPAEGVARFLGGDRPVTVVQPPAAKTFDIDVVVPVADMAEPGETNADHPEGGAEPDADTEPERRSSIWPHVEERLAGEIGGRHTTLVFANSRRLAERLTARLNEVHARQLAEGEDDPAPPDTVRPPAEVMAEAGTSDGAPAALARAHHGSVSKEQRALIEDDLKTGRLPCVVATSSLELGIDMGAVDLVVQVEAPPSVASGLQRIGRAGHQVGAVSRGLIFPKYRGDLVTTAVAVERMRDGLIEETRVPANPLDVLAQQIVAACSVQDRDADELYALIRRAAPFATLPRSAYDAVLDMLSGRYPSDEFAELRPRLVWDRPVAGDGAGRLSARPSAQRLAVTSGGTIPDRGLFGVFLAGSAAEEAGGRSGPGKRVGELDEEMVYESRVGDVFTLGASTWRIEDITHDRVLVSPAPGRPGKLPFWHGDAPGRPAELGRAVGGFVRELDRAGPDAARERARDAGLDAWATDNLVSYLDEQRQATGRLPTDRTLVVERFHDELGDWRICLHSPYGRDVHAPWALAIQTRLQERYGVDAQAIAGDDGIVLRIPETDAEPPGAEIATFDPDEIEELVTTEVGSSALFAARFRECAARALLLPRRAPGRRAPLWQQRQRSAQLLAVASKYGSFPIVLETVRECLHDVYDLPALMQLLRDIAARRIRIVEVETTEPSPFARSLTFGYIAAFLYEGDAPLAERKAAALALDQSLLAELLGRTELRELLDPGVVCRTEAELQRLAPERRCRHAEDVADLLRLLGPLTTGEVTERSNEGAAVTGWLEELERARRVIRVPVGGQERWAGIEDAGRLRDALGVPLPVGIPDAFTEPVADPLGDLVAAYARTHGPFTPAAVAERFGLGVAVVHDTLRRLAGEGRAVEGQLRPGADGTDWCDPGVLRTLRGRSLAALRHEVEPVEPATLARFLPRWQHVGGSLRGVDGVLRAVEQLAGCPVPASALEPLVLASRVADYAPALLDELTAAGEICWVGHGALPGSDGWVSLHPVETAPLTLPEPDAEFEPSPVHAAVLAALEPGGAFFFRQLADAVASTVAGTLRVDDADLVTALWDLVWAGHLTNDTLAPLRTLLAGGGRASGRSGASGGASGGTHRARSRPPRGRMATGRGAGGQVTGGSVRSRMPSRTGPPTAAGRWSLVPPRETDPTRRGMALAESLLDRHGVVTRGAVAAEGPAGGFAAVYRVLSAFEESGRARRGYFVAGLGAAQFGASGAVDRLRAEVGETEPAPGAGRDRPPAALVLAATDPANPYGGALPWPERPAPGSPETAGARGHRPGRKAGALVVLVAGALVLYVERGGRTLLSWSDDPELLRPAADALALAVRGGVLGRLTVERANGEAVLGPGEAGPVAEALAAAGFHATPRGLRLRR